VHGVTPEHRIIGAQGHFPLLGNLQTTCIECFRKQVELVDYTGQTDLHILATELNSVVARSPGAFPEECDESNAFSRLAEADGFTTLRPGGRREPLAYDRKGFFIITVDRPVGDIVLRHYLPDNKPAHIMRARTAESILLGLLREDLLSQYSHAGYLGAELAKAETALRLNLLYEQDQPLRLRPAGEINTEDEN
jgi:tetrahydromethanopterin S-methyltransferase subunit A